ncbi:MAG TPA: hydantoinase B/oxoprolinase family protein [Stellaceae bacterium]|nr:hydantoinase B/oxoprolinase family protein [Stellaceae bacterium]
MSSAVSRARNNRSIVDDPVALQVAWTRLIAIADEAAATLRRTSFSPIVRESNDFACVIFDRDGNAIAENTIGIPSFNMTLGRTLAHFLSIRPAAEWRAGDVGICNDPWLTSGHLPDITIVAPVFAGERLIAWTGSIAHMADIGGTLWSADTREVYEEGIRIPPLLYLRQGQPNADLQAMIRANVRLPEPVLGDIAAQIAAGETAARGLADLLEREDIGDLSSVSREICARTERSMRGAIAQIPDGTYRSALDLDGTGEEPVHIEVAIEKRGEEIFIDYTGTSPEVGRALNTVMNYTEAYSCYPLKCALDPGTPRNEGTYRMIHVTAPEGSILNPRFPAPVHARQLVGHCLAAAIYEALAPVLGDRIVAESGSAPTLRVLVSGYREDRRRYTSILFINGGMGARAGRDGLSATCFPSNVVCGSMEIIEALSPLRIWRKELASDSGGPGRQRGGLGQDVEVELTGDQPGTLSLLVERVWHPARGVLGGVAGAASRVVWNGRESGFPLKGKSRIAAGDRLNVRYPGGGGFGDPRERDRAEVQADLEAGLISETTAREVYGL